MVLWKGHGRKKNSKSFCDFEFFFGRVMNRELNQRVGLAKLECKAPTLVFDMPSSRRYEAKHEKMLPRPTPKKKYEGLAGPEISYLERLLFFENKNDLFVSPKVMIAYTGGGKV